MRKVVCLLFGIVICCTAIAQSAAMLGVNGKIVLTFKGNFPDARKKCAQQAADLWMQHIVLKQDVEFLLRCKDIGADALPVKTEVVYVPKGDNRCVTAAYDRAVNDVPTQGTDAVITYNTNAFWDCDFPGYESSYDSDFLGETLRGIACALGFGTSFYKHPQKGVVSAVPGCYSPFDELVFNQYGVSLNTLPLTGRQEQSVMDFIKGENGAVYVSEKNDSYQLYASNDEKGGYLSYFEADGSLMSHDWKIQHKDYNSLIDERTLRVLEEIGWEISRSNLCIKPDEEVAAGNASIYGTHTFTAEAEKDAVISEYSWTLELKDSTGNYVAVQTAQSPAFTLSPIEGIEDYENGYDANLQGRVVLQASVNGIREKAAYIVYLNLKPVITRVVTEVISPDYTKGNFILGVEVHYKGSDHINLNVEQEDTPEFRAYYLYEPDIARKEVVNLFLDIKTWLYFSCSNLYGETTYTVELPALINSVSNSSLRKKSPDFRSLSAGRSMTEYIEVYTMDSVFMKRLSSLSEPGGELKNGQYLLKIKKENSTILENKTIVVE